MNTTTNLKSLPAYIANKLHGGAKRHWEVMAGPGSGKTTYLINLLLALLKRGVEPSAIVVLSFGTNTVKEFNKRVSSLISSGTLDREVVAALRSVKVRTIHSMALHMLGPQHAKVAVGDVLLTHVREAIDEGWAEVSTIEPSVRARRHLYRHLDDLRLGAGPELLLKIFDHARATGEDVAKTAASLAPSTFDHVAAVLPRMLEAYEASLARAGFSDFAKLLRDAVKEGKVPALQYVLVDEYQDCTASQRTIFGALARKADHVVVVGDVHQSLYGFAGAYPARLSTLLPNVGLTRLNTTQRFTTEIAALANAVAGLSGKKQIVASRHGPRPVLIESPSYHAGLEAVAHRVLQLVAEGVDLAEIAVIARTKMLLKDVEDHLLRNHGIHCSRNGLGPHVGAVKTVLRLVGRVRATARDEGTVSVEDVQACWHHGAATDSVCLAKALPKLRRAVMLAAKAPDRALDRVYRPCADAFLAVLRATGVEALAFKGIRNEVMKWAPAAANYTSTETMYRAVQGGDKQRVVTTTMHRAKGMEWQHVLVVGVTDGLMPIYKVKDDDEQGLQQERNAFYVAITRAKDTVTLFHAPRPHSRTRKMFDKPSRFLVNEAVQDAFDWHQR